MHMFIVACTASHFIAHAGTCAHSRSCACAHSVWGMRRLLIMISLHSFDWYPRRWFAMVLKIWNVRLYKNRWEYQRQCLKNIFSVFLNFLDFSRLFCCPPHNNKISEARKMDEKNFLKQEKLMRKKFSSKTKEWEKFIFKKTLTRICFLLK